MKRVIIGKYFKDLKSAKNYLNGKNRLFKGYQMLSFKNGYLIVTKRVYDDCFTNYNLKLNLDVK